MRHQQRQRNGLQETMRRVLLIPLLYWQFIKYQPSMIGRVIALIPAALLFVAIALLVI